MVDPVLHGMFLGDVLLTALIDTEGSLGTWAICGSWQTESCLEVAVRQASGVRIHINRQVIERGLARALGCEGSGPTGLDVDAHSRIVKADAKQDASHLTPAAASMVIQLGVFGRVLYR